MTPASSATPCGHPGAVHGESDPMDDHAAQERATRHEFNRVESEDHALKLRIKKLRSDAALASRKERRAISEELETLRLRRAEMRTVIESLAAQLESLRLRQQPGLS